MEKEATKIFEMVLNNSADLNKEIRMQVYKLLDLDGKKLSIYENEDIKIKEEIKSSIERFSFNLQETQFLNQVQEIIKEEIQKLQTSSNYDMMQSSLIERLKGLRNIDITLEDDFKELSSRIANPFISRDMFNNYFIAKKEKITDMIKSYNQTIIDSLINLTPKLIEELKSEKQKENTQQQATTTSVNLENHIANIDTKIEEINGEKKKGNTSQEITNSGNIIVNQDQLINACKTKYNELQRRLSYLANGNYGSGSRINAERGQLKYVISQLDDFIKSLSIEKQTQDLIKKYSNETDFNKMIESIISEAIPRMTELNSLTDEVDHIYGKSVKVDYSQYELPSIDFEMLHNKIITSTSLKDLLAGKKMIEQWLGNLDYDTNQRLKEEYNLLIDKIIILSMENEKKKNTNPEPTPNVDTAVGNSKSDVEYLVKSNNFYGILQGIQSHSVEKYRDFIMSGFNTIMSRWQQQAELCNTFIEREKSYQDFADLYENFKDYLPIETGNMLNQNLEEMKKYIEQQKLKHNEIDGVRYNNSEEQLNQNHSSMKM